MVNTCVNCKMMSINVQVPEMVNDKLIETTNTLIYQYCDNFISFGSKNNKIE